MKEVDLVLRAYTLVLWNTALCELSRGGEQWSPLNGPWAGTITGASLSETSRKIQEKDENHHSPKKEWADLHLFRIKSLGQGKYVMYWHSALCCFFPLRILVSEAGLEFRKQQCTHGCVKGPFPWCWGHQAVFLIPYLCHSIGYMVGPSVLICVERMKMKRSEFSAFMWKFVSLRK